MSFDTQKLSLALALICSLGAAVTAQEIGGSLGSSAGIFRPKSSAAATGKTVKKSARTTRTAARTAERPKPLRGKAGTAATARANRKEKIAATPKISAEVAEQVETMLAAGNEARDARAFINAEHAYRTALEMNPRDARAVYGLGNIYTDQQRWDEAETAYRAALKIDSEQAEANIALCYVLLQSNRGGNVAARFAEAEAAARRALAINPQNPFAHAQLGVALEKRGLPFAEIESEYRRAIELEPNFALAHAHLGRLLKKAGKEQDSAISYEQAVELAQDVPMLILVAEVLQSENMFAESEKLARKASQMDEDNPTAMFLLGRALLMLGNFAESEEYLTRSIRISPRTFAVYTALAAVYLRQDKFEDAERILNDATPLAANVERRQLAGGAGFSAVGDGYLKRGDRSAALRMYLKAFDLDEKNDQLSAKIAAAKNELR